MATQPEVAPAPLEPVNTRTSDKVADYKVGAQDVDDDGIPISDAIRRARDAAERQAGMSIRQGLRVHRWAVFWSGMMTLTWIMESYDYGLMGNLYGFPSFAERYGELLPSGKYNISAGQQSLLKQITKLGQLIGLAATGPAVDRFGYKWTMLASLAFMVPIIAMQFFAPNLNVMVGAQLLIGIPLGPFTTLSNVYAAEVAPLCLQPYLTSATSLGSNCGYMIAAGILRGLIDVDGRIKWSYRIAFAIQWGWLLPLAIIVILAPESPTWCVKTGRIDRARIALKRLSSKEETEEDLENRLALMQYTDEVERKSTVSTSYVECFRGVNRRRTEIACLVYACQNLDGYTLANSSGYFFQRAGLSAKDAFSLGLGNYAISFIAVALTWFMLPYFGRRIMFNWGLALTVLILVAIGGLGIPEPSAATGWATGGFCFLFNIVFHFTQGPLVYLLVADMPSTRLRQKTVILARITFIASAVFMVVLTNYQINVTAWNWRGKAGFFWAGSCLIMTIWAYYRLPETKDRSASELDELFERRISARQFKNTKVQAVEASRVENFELRGTAPSAAA